MFNPISDSKKITAPKLYCEIYPGAPAESVRAFSESGDLYALLCCDFDYAAPTSPALNSWHNNNRDRLLETVTEAIAARLREKDVVIRVNSREFVIVLRTDALINAPQVAARLTEMFDQPVQLGDCRVHVSCSIGVSFYPSDGQDTDELLAKANRAMQGGRDGSSWSVQLYPSHTSQAIYRRLQIEQALQQPDLPHQLEMLYQPQWDHVHGCLYGFEGLVRWHHPTLGEISPDEFIPIAEDLSVIHRVTHWAIATALRFSRDVLDRHNLILRASVNVSALEFETFHRLYRTIDQQLRYYRLQGSTLTVELTERVFLQPSEQIISHMAQLCNRGISVALDDFGTGFSGLHYLLDLPLNVLKIDRSFIKNLDQDPRRRGIVQAIATMAKSLAMRCVAEGVETSAEWECLQKSGCTLMQGNLFSPALSEKSFLELIGAS